MYSIKNIKVQIKALVMKFSRKRNFLEFANDIVRDGLELCVKSGCIICSSIYVMISLEDLYRVRMVVDYKQPHGS